MKTSETTDANECNGHENVQGQKKILQKRHNLRKRHQLFNRNIRKRQKINFQRDDIHVKNGITRKTQLKSHL